MRKYLTVLMVVVLLSLVFLPQYSAPSQALAQDALRQALFSTVRIIVPVEGTDMASTGSGSVLTEDGLILSNMHVVADMETGEFYNSDRQAGIAINTDLRSMPQMTFLAEFVRGDFDLDLSLLQIVAYVDGDPLPSDLSLPVMPVGDSDDVNEVDIGLPIYVIGFPGLGGGSVTFTEGVVAGFLEAGVVDEGAWIKTDAEVNKGNSGGAAISQGGTLIGVPTLGVSDPETAGKLSLIRPINEASDLIAGKGQTEEPDTGFGFPKDGKSTGNIGPITFALGFDDTTKKPVDPGTEFPSGTTKVLGIFDYENMQNGVELGVQYYYNGQKDVGGSYDWKGGASGIDYVWIKNEDGLAPGEYGLELYVGGGIAQKGSFTILRSGGGGGLPIVEGDVLVMGIIRDADTQRGLSGAIFAVLNPGVSVREFLATEDESMIFAYAKTDQRGYFELNRKLSRGEAYGLIVGAKGYQPILEDNSQVPEDAPGRLELTIDLQKG
jgi:hypothetical protein